MLDDPALRRELVAVAHLMADAAARETVPRFRRPDLAADNKAAAGFDPVTEADRAAERAMRDVLARRRPGDAVLGEEGGARAGTSGVVWTLDPIDGTRAYLAGAPVWGTLIAVGDARGPAHGIVDQPWTDERFEGGWGEAHLTRAGERTRLRTRSRPLAEATLLSTFPEVGTGAERAAFGRLAERARLVRYGLDCYGYALVAAGCADLVVEAGLAPHDVRAPMALVEAAGGRVTAWDGGPARDGGRVVAAGCPRLHAEVVALLSAAPG